MGKVGAVRMDVATKKSGSLVIAFPDVCKVPGQPGGMVPVPYPNVAKTAIAKQQGKKMAGATKVVSGSSKTMGDEAGTQRGIISTMHMGKAMFNAGSSKVRVEGQQLRTKLSAIHNQMQHMTGNDPAEWQALLQDYASTAAALYVTINDD